MEADTGNGATAQARKEPADTAASSTRSATPAKKRTKKTKQNTVERKKTKKKEIVITQAHALGILKSAIIYAHKAGIATRYRQEEGELSILLENVVLINNDLEIASNDRIAGNKQKEVASNEK